MGPFQRRFIDNPELPGYKIEQRIFSPEGEDEMAHTVSMSPPSSFKNDVWVETVEMNGKPRRVICTGLRRVGEAPKVTDDLDSKTLPQLQTLAGHEGVEYKPNMLAPELVIRIRDARKAKKGGGK